MNKVRLTKEFAFEMAHSLHNYDGLCKHIHGHSYKLSVTVIACPNKDKDSVKYGMVMDFGDLKEIVNRLIVKPLDHSYMIGESAPREFALSNVVLFQRMVVVPFQPTCENMVIDFAAKISAELPSGILLHSLKLHETATSFAEWFAEDNK